MPSGKIPYQLRAKSYVFDPITATDASDISAQIIAAEQKAHKDAGSDIRYQDSPEHVQNVFASMKNNTDYRASEFFFKAYAKLTRDLSGISFKQELPASGQFASSAHDQAAEMADLFQMYYSSARNSRDSGESGSNKYELAMKSFQIIAESTPKYVKSLKSPALNSVSSMASDIRECGFLISHPELLKQAVDIYISSSAKVSSRISDYFTTVNHFLSRMGEQKTLTPENAKKIMEDLANFGVRVEQMGPTYSYEAFWALRLTCRDDNRTPVQDLVSDQTKKHLAIANAYFQRGQEIRGYFEATIQRGVELSPAFVERIAKLQDLYGITQFSRLQSDPSDFAVIDEIIRNADPKYNSDKPVAVVFMPVEGSGLIFDAFSAGAFYNSLTELAKDHKLLVFSVASPQSMLRAAEYSEIYGGGKGIDILQPGGHGSDPEKGKAGMNLSDPMFDPPKLQEKELPEDLKPKAINLSPEPTAFFDRTKFFAKSFADTRLDPSNKEHFKIMQQIMGHVNPSGMVASFSCEAGKGMENGNNLANWWAKAAPSNRTINAYGGDGTISGLEYAREASGKISGVNFFRMNDDREKSVVPTYKAVSGLRFLPVQQDQQNAIAQPMR